MAGYDAFLLLSFGGPEQREDVIPFLETVLRGRSIPRERLLEVAEHYYHFDGRSPINDQNRRLIAAIEAEFARLGIHLPVYWGNRNWHPFLGETLGRMHRDGIRRALAFATSAFGSYSGCRQYLEDIAAARAGFGPGAPEIEKLRIFYNHPGFIDAVASRIREAFSTIPETHRASCRLIFTAHSIPLSMAAASPYVEQVKEACRLAAQRSGYPEWELAYQSRSGPPGQPWLEPDINVRIRELAAAGARTLIVVPIGFLSDHMEVVYDLDTEAQATADAVGVTLVRAQTVGTHPEFVSTIRKLVEERLHATPAAATGTSGPWPDVCPPDCCPAPVRLRPERADR